MRRIRSGRWCLLIGMLACAGDKPVPYSGPVDEDGDGFHAAEDCDDGDATVHPGAAEVWYDGIDQGCDGGGDGDADGDGEAARGHGGYDCDDADATRTTNAPVTLALGVETTCGSMAVSARRYWTQAHQTGPVHAAAGDTNGDGLADVLMGSTQVDTEVEDGGAVYLELGPIEGDESLAGADAMIVGLDGEHPIYLSVGLGDTDNDGFGDVLLTLVFSEEVDAYVAAVFSGPLSGDLGVTDADGVWGPGDIWGIRNGGAAGDTNGDGYADMLYNHTLEDTDYDGIGVALGPLAGTRTTDEGVAWIHSAIDSDQCAGAGIGDTDGDGLDDLLVSCRAAQVTGLVRGPVTGDLLVNEAEATFVDPWMRSRAVGDTNGDGLADLLMSTYYTDSAYGEDRGASFVFHSPVMGYHDPYDDADAILLGATDEDRADGAIAAGDLNADGFDDIQVHAGGLIDDDSPGRVYLVLSPVEGVTYLDRAWWTLLSPFDDSSVNPTHPLGDTNADGYDDLMFATNGETVVLEGDGAFYLLAGGPA